MKKIGSLLFGLLWIQLYCWGQLDPEPLFDWIDANNVSGRINSNGALFYDFENGQFSVNGEPSTIRAMGFWFSGIDPAGNLKGAAQLYNEEDRADFLPGFLNFDGTPFEPVFNGVWKVTKDDVQAHIQAWEAAQQAGQALDPNLIPSANLAWPARGNAFFFDNNGFEMPATTLGVGPFWDQDGDGIYSPDQGDYPRLDIRNMENPATPDQMLWTTFHDYALHTESQLNQTPLEVQLTAFAYECSENELLNNTVFLRYKLINFNVELMDSTFFALFADFDIGCPEDDYFGSIPGMRTMYVYNADNEDEGCQGFASFGENPPVQAITFFRGPFNELAQYADNYTYVGIDEHNPDLSLPSPGIEYHRLLSGANLAGNPLEHDGMLYPDNPNWANGSSELSLGNIAGDRKALSSFEPIRLDPGAVNEIVVALTYYRKPGANNLENVQEVYANTWKLISAFESDFVDPCTITACDTCVWPGETDHDGIVSNLDILPIGIGYGESGPERIDASIDWMPHEGTDWTQTLASGSNYKHIDANGDGIINEQDALVVDANYGLYNTDDETPVVSNPGVDLYLMPSVDTLEEGEEVTVEIFLGSETEPIEDIYGLAFSVAYDPGVLYYSGTSFDGGWVANGDELLHLTKDVPLLGQVQFGLSRIDHANVSGQGLIGSFSLTVKDDIMGRANSIETLLELVNIRGISQNETDLDIGGKNHTLTIIDTDITNVTYEAGGENPILLYPNPAKELVNVQLPWPEDAEIEIFDNMGKMVFRQKTKGETMTIATDGFSPGVYVLKVQLKEVSWRRKFLVLW